jgi:CubicO group peptidase (beta-lactamase class C family)
MSGTDRSGFSLTRLARIGDYLQREYVDRNLLPGTLVQVWRKGEIAYSALAGSIDLERARPMSEDAIFRIYSMTKPITAVALMMLAEEGRLSLTDDVETWIPSWRGMSVYKDGALGHFRTVPAKRPIKVIDLCTHTSGLTYGSTERTPIEAAYRELGVAAKTTEGGLGAMMEQLAGLPLTFSPGDAWNYSVAIDVMGYLVEKISGLPFGEFLRRRIFEPLGMVDTSFWCPPEKLDRFASCYEAKADGSLFLQDDARKSTYAQPPKLESGGGGLVSTAADYMRFCRMMLNGGSLDGVQIISPKTVAMFSVNYLPDGRDMVDMTTWSFGAPEGYAGVGYSLACAVNANLAKTRLPGSQGEFFWSGAASTYFWIDPVEDLAVVFMTQVMAQPTRFAMRRGLRQLVYGAMTESLA